MSLETAKLELQKAIEKAQTIDAATHLRQLEAKERERTLKANESKMRYCLIGLSLLITTPLLYCSFTLVKSLL